MKYYTTKEASKIIGISGEGVRKRIVRKKIKYIKEGKFYLIPQSELNLYINNKLSPK